MGMVWFECGRSGGGRTSLGMVREIRTDPCHPRLVGIARAPDDVLYRLGWAEVSDAAGKS